MQPYKQLNDDNTASLDELRAFAGTLSQDDWLHPLSAGWTPASVLVHIAFWDLRATALLARWQQEGIGPSDQDTDLINEATRVPFLAIPPHKAIEVALSAAEAVNRAIADLSPDMIDEIREKGKTMHLNRADHKRMHIEDIREQLGK